MRAIILGFSLMAGLAFTACSNEVTTEEAPKASVKASVTLADVIAHPRRAEETARDQFRHPQGTLDFFEIKPGLSVAEVWPGWYTNILAPYFAENEGQYVAVLFPEGVNERLDKRVADFKAKYGDTDTYGTIEYAGFMKDSPLSLPEGSMDRVLTFRNTHSWMRGGYAEQAFAEFYKALKPGGILGVVQHRLPETRLQDPKAGTGYVQESYIKALASEAGFEFVESSEVNANALDTADHPMGVWTLPPRSRTPDEGTAEAADFDAELYKNIGESDRATLKFKKPL